MLKNEDILCISSIDWDFIWQGHQEIMTRLARAGNRVLFIENTGVRVPTLRDLGRIRNRILNWRKGLHGIRKIEPGLYVYSPLVLPFPYLRLARLINKKLMFSVLMKWLKAVGFTEPVVWAFLPTGLTLDLIAEIGPKVLIYYCIDSFKASSKDARKIEGTERLILKKADLVFATSHELLSHCGQYNPNVHYFPFGVNIDVFTAIINKKESKPADMKGIRQPIAGYVGGIHKWIDCGLVKFVAQANKDVSFVFCGPIQTDIAELKGLPNVFFLGQKRPEELPNYVKEFDCALIPYKITEYTKSVYPTKLNEYLSLGKAVISTTLPEVVKFNIENGNAVRVAETPEKFSELLKASLKNSLSDKERLSLMEVAKRNSWTARLEQMVSLIKETIDKRAMERERSWRDNISRIYKGARKKALPLVITAAVLYVVVFKTPLVLYLARPLYINDVPRQSDVIAVFGGGVGESGKVGEGYEERVNTALRLYSAHLAGKIAYFSGYRYIMKEAEVMKGLSVFLGVKANDIILEEKSANTYEMIIGLKGLMRANGWKAALLVSSPYHMKRLKLLCDKYMAGTTVYCVPVENSRFYDFSQGIKPRHIKGILHEYLAIAFYKMKKYL